MNIPSAIKRLEQLQIDLKYWQDPTKLDAIQLGIEALKWANQIRYGDPAHHKERLPGETEL
jgi:hypothetical protein